MQDHIDRIEYVTKLKTIKDVFLVGSRACNTHNNNSDYDFIVIADDAVDGRQYNTSNFNITTYTPQHFQEKLNENKPFAIECFFLPNQCILKMKTKYSLKLVNFEQEYLNKIKEDQCKILKVNDFNKKIKIKFFIFKLRKQLKYLKTGNSFEFDFNKAYRRIRQKIITSGI